MYTYKYEMQVLSAPICESGSLWPILSTDIWKLCPSIQAGGLQYPEQGKYPNIAGMPQLHSGLVSWLRLVKSGIQQTSVCPGLGMTQCQDEFRILSGRTQKWKVAKRCWKQFNEHNLMYIYHIQCENMQKIQWKSSNGQIQRFKQATSGALWWKPQKTRKTRET